MAKAHTIPPKAFALSFRKNIIHNIHNIFFNLGLDIKYHRIFHGFYLKCNILHYSICSCFVVLSLSFGSLISLCCQFTSFTVAVTTIFLTNSHLMNSPLMYRITASAYQLVKSALRCLYQSIDHDMQY